MTRQFTDPAVLQELQGIPVDEKKTEDTTIQESGRKISDPSVLREIGVKSPETTAPVLTPGEQRTIPSITTSSSDTPKRRLHFLQSVSSDNPFDPVTEKRLFDRQAEINRMPLTNPIEFFQSLGAAIKFDLTGDQASTPFTLASQREEVPIVRKLAKALFPIYNGVRAGEFGWFDMLDRTADFIAKTTGFPKGGLFERLKFDVQPYDRPETIAGRVMQDLAGAPFEIAKFVVGKGAGTVAAKSGLTMLPSMAKYANLITRTGQTVGVGTMGALEHLGEGPMEVAKGAAYFVIVDRIFSAVGGMPRVDRMTTMGGVFGGLTAVSGGDKEEIISSIITGSVMGAMGGKGRDELSYSNLIREQVIKTKLYKRSLAKQRARAADANTLVFETKDVALDYLRTHYPETYNRIKAEGIGQVKVRLDKPSNLIRAVNASFDQTLGLKGEQAKIPLRTKIEMVFKQADPHNNIPAKVRIPIIDAFETNINKLHTDLVKKYNPNIKAETADIARQRRRSSEKVDNAIAKNIDAKAAQGEGVKKSIGVKIQEGLFDTSAFLNGGLLKKAGSLGRDTVMFHDLIAGTPMRAQLWYAAAETKVYKGLARKDIPILDAIIFNRNVIQIDARKAPKDRPRHTGGITGRDSAKWMESLHVKLGDAKYADLVARSDSWFAVMRGQLDLALKSKIISKELHKKLMKFDWSPRELIRQIDPKVEGPSDIGGKPISVRDSGIEFLGRGSKEAVNIDSRELLAQVITRNMSRIARNNANLAAREIALKIKDNPFFRSPSTQGKKIDKKGRVQGIKTPKGFDRVNVWIDGKQEPLFVNQIYSKSWISSNPQISREVAYWTRALSGSWFIRPLATGYNPGFAVVNFTRDIAHMWIASREFSAILPIYGGQLVRNLTVTAKDAFMRTGRYRDFIDQNGGMAFLTHQGRDFALTPGKGSVSNMKATLHPKLQGIKKAFGYLNETSEIWTRLALRDQAIRNRSKGLTAEQIANQKGVIEQQATWEARRYLDFSQGGKFAKTADHAIPYFNASLQALRGFGRGAKENPIRFAAQVGQMMMLESGLWWANNFLNPEAIAHVSEQEQTTSFIITTPISFIDPITQEKQHVYFSIKKDNNLIPFTSVARWGFNRFVHGEVPDISSFRSVSRIARNALPITPDDVNIPAISAMLTSFHNYDMWTESKVWGGKPVPPQLEFDRFPRRPTPEFWIMAGDQLGISPKRTQATFSKLAPRNMYTDLVGGGLQSMLAPSGQEQIVMENTNFWQWAARAPVFRRFIKITHPFANQADKIEDAGREANALTVEQNRNFDEIFFKNRLGKLPGGDDTISAWISSQPPQDRRRLADRFKDSIVVQRIFEASGKTLPGNTSRIWWLNLRRLDPKARAHLVFNVWVDLDSGERERLMTLAGRLKLQKDKNGKFITEFNRRKSLHDF